MSHEHHHHTTEIINVNRAFYFGIGLNFLFVIIEVIAGLNIHSLSLLSDAGHNLADVSSLALSLLAFRLMKVKPTETYTYGYRKTSILVALFNSAVLLASIAGITYEALHRLFNPQPLPGFTIAVIAAIGIFINAVSALLFLRDKEKDINIKSAYIHLLSDALVSFGIVIGGIIIYYTQLYWIDAVISILIALVILVSTWNLLRSSLRLSMDAVPEGLTVDKVKAAMLKTSGVKQVHHIHLWAMSTTENALTAHIIVDAKTNIGDVEKIKQQIKHSLLHLNIHHSTIEFEPEGSHCVDDDAEV